MEGTMNCPSRLMGSRIPRRMSYSCSSTTPRDANPGGDSATPRLSSGSCCSSENGSPATRKSTWASEGAVEDAVRVIVRVRPMNEREMNACRGPAVVSTIEGRAVLLSDPVNRPDPYAVQVDRALDVDSTQEDMFDAVGAPMVDHCLDGFNSTIFAYGQTGSGKTYTMMGEVERNENGALNHHCGLIPRVFEGLFAAIAERERCEASHGQGNAMRYSVKCSFLEIYNEEITDLLDPSSTGLQIRDGDSKRGVYVQGLSETEVLNGAFNVLLQNDASST